MRLIYGAGVGGKQLYDVLRSEGGPVPRAFIDDNEQLHATRLRGVAIISFQAVAQLSKFFDLEVVISMPRLADKEVANVITKLEVLGVKILKIPGVGSLPGGRVNKLIKILSYLTYSHETPFRQIRRC